MYLIYHPASKEWFRAPGLGMTWDEDHAHRFTRAEADRVLEHNPDCEAVPLGQPPREGGSE